MDLETLGILVGIILAVAGIIIGVTKWIEKKIVKKISIVAQEEIAKSQTTCERGRVEVMNALIERVERLEKSDNDTKLVIVSIQKDLEALTAHHETTQAMILSLQNKFQDTTTQLIDTIKSITMKA